MKKTTQTDQHSSSKRIWLLASLALLIMGCTSHPLDKKKVSNIDSITSDIDGALQPNTRVSNEKDAVQANRGCISKPYLGSFQQQHTGKIYQMCRDKTALRVKKPSGKTVSYLPNIDWYSLRRNKYNLGGSIKHSCVNRCPF